MVSHRIVCTEQTDCSRYGHIVAVGVGDDPKKASRRRTVSEVYLAMDRGEVFYTSADGFVALVNKYRCPCGRWTLRSEADATTANNLDSLRLCHWSAA